MRNREEAALSAEQSQTNVPGTCQLWTRNRFDAPSAGDRDGDGDADAVDGWLSEPASAKHYGDRNPPRGTPVAWSGGSKGFGHRAVSLGNGKIRSTDMSDDGLRYQKGNVGTTTIANVDRAMGLNYLGWSETITGARIPLPPSPKPKPKPKPKITETAITKARDLLVGAERKALRKGQKKRASKIRKMLKVGPKS